MEKDNWFNLGVAIGMIAVFILSVILCIVRCFSDLENQITFLAFIYAAPFASFIVKCFLGIAKEY